MSMLLMVKAMSIEVGNSTRKFVLLKLADNANDKGECFPSYQHIADHCEISRRSAINHINALCEQGFVKKVYRKGEKGNSSNIFILNLYGEKSALPNEESALDGENNSLPSENDSPPPSENSAPRTSHSFESVNESKKINKKPMSSGDDEKRQTKINYQSIVDAYNEVLGERLPCVKKISKKRERSIKSFMTERLNKNSLDAAISYFKAFSERAKPFYFGDNKTGWIANFDFVIREDTVIAVREGTISKAEFVG